MGLPRSFAIYTSILEVEIVSKIAHRDINDNLIHSDDAQYLCTRLTAGIAAAQPKLIFKLVVIQLV